MDLKEAHYILTIARQESTGKAVRSLSISQPSLSKYFRNLENQLGRPLFYRMDSCYTPTYMSEHYPHYAEQTAAYGEQWNREYKDINHRKYGRLNVATPIVMGSVLIWPTLMGFHNLYSYATINMMKAVNSIAETSLKSHSTGLTFYNVHVSLKLLGYEVMRREEIVLILSAGHPLVFRTVDKPDFRHPRTNLNLLPGEDFTLLHPGQNTGGIALRLSEDYNMNSPILLHTRNSEMPIKLTMEGLGVTFAPKGYHRMAASRGSHPFLCLSIGKSPIVTTTIAAYPKGRYLPQYARDYMEAIREYCAGKRQTGLFYSKVKTTDLAGGLFCPYKGLLPVYTRKAH